MDATPHFIVGAAVGRRLHPVPAFGIGVVSHAVLDAIPHYNYSGWRPLSLILASDIAVGALLALVIAFLAPRPWGALAGAAGGVFPDVERVLSGQQYDFLKRPPLALPDVEFGLPWGLVTQGIVIVLALLVGLRRGGGRAGR